jgi:hypothetical protein
VSPDFSTPNDGIVVKTDAKGTLQWKKTFGGSGFDSGNAVQQTPDGGYIVAGLYQGDPCTSQPATCFYLLKLDSAGNKDWDRMIGSSSLNGAYAVDVTRSGGNWDGYVITGSDVSNNVALIKTDLTGNIVWQRSFNGTVFGWDVGFAVEQTADGGYIIAGDTPTGNSNIAEMWLIKTDPDGVKQWDKRFGTGEAFSVKQTPDGGFVMAGRTTVLTFVAPPPPAGDAVIIRTDKDGNLLWRKTFGGAEDDEARSVTLAKDGGYVLAGKTLSYGPGPVDQNAPWQWEDVFLIKLDAYGNTVWQKVKGHRPNSSDGAQSVYAASDGGYVFTGNSNFNTPGTLLLMKTDKNGDTVNLGAEDLTITVPSTTGSINFTNAIEVAAAGVTGFTFPREVGATALELLIAMASGAPVDDFCNGGGSYSPASATLSIGTPLPVTLTNCVNGPSGDQRTLNGSFTITVDSFSGSLSSDYTVQTTISGIDVTSTESGGALTSTAAGAMRFRRQSTSDNLTELSESVTTPAPATLTFSETGGSLTRTHVVGPFSTSDTVNTSGAFSLGAIGETATVETGAVSGALTVTILQPVQGAGGEPNSGSFRITAQDNSRLTATLSSGGVSLAIDTNADGTDDGTISTSWDFLD